MRTLKIYSLNNFPVYPTAVLAIVSLTRIQFSCLFMSDSLRLHGLQHTRLPCPSPTPRACSNLCPSSWWCHPTILSSVVPFSSRLQSFPASGSFQMSQFFTSGGQRIGASASASVLPMNVCEVAQSCPTLCDPMDCSLPGFSVHGILQARILEWVTISFSRGYSQPRDRTRVSRIGGRRLTSELPGKPHIPMNIQDWFPLGLTGLISFLSKGLSRVFSNTTVQKHQFFSTQLSL